MAQEEVDGWPAPMTPVVPPPNPSHRAAWAVAIGVAIVIVVALGGLAAIQGDLRGLGGSDDVVAEPDPPPPASRALPLDATPTTGLVDGSTVLLAADFLEPSTIAVVQICLDVPSRIAVRPEVDCRPDTQVLYPVPAEGPFTAAYQVPRRVATAEGGVDCQPRPGSCLLLVQDRNDDERSGFAPLTFRDAEPATPVDRTSITYGGPKAARTLPASLTPTGTLHGPTTVTVTVTGFLPGEPLILGRCSADLEGLDGDIADVAGTCEPVDDGALAPLLGSELTKIEVHAGPDGSFTTEVEARPKIQPIAVREDLMSLVPSTTTVSTDAAGQIRCTSRPGACTLVVAAVADVRRGGVVPYTITAD